MISIKADAEGGLCISHILLLALSALHEVNYILGRAGGCGTYVEEAASGCALNGGAFLQVGAASSAVTVPASTCCV